MPIINRGLKTSKFYKPLSRLLTRKYRAYLSVYRKMEACVATMLQSYSKQLSIHVHHVSKAVTIPQCHIGNLICTITTPSDDTTRYILISYKDGVQLKYNPSTDAGEVAENGLQVANIVLNTRLRKMSVTDGREMQRYSFHLIFAQEAIYKCIEICKQIISECSEGGSTMPMTVVVRGQSVNDWHVMGDER